MLSALASDVVVACLFVLRRQTFARAGTLVDSKAIRRRMVQWRCRVTCFWIIVVCHFTACTAICVIFLANVSLATVDSWGLTALFTILQDFFIMPLIFALLLATLASLILCCRPSARTRAFQHVEAHENSSLDEESKEAKERRESLSSIPNTDFTPEWPDSKLRERLQDVAQEIQSTKKTVSI
mmetsp:Transcript_77803/g.175914  ORF Transcript_77803/g.175914 Transcript_77803/m.175914 type:complete len:183 (+) Transcript_77803:3-551(+)